MRRTLLLSQSPEGSAPDFHTLCDATSAVFALSQSPEGSTPDFHEQEDRRRPSGRQDCLNPPKGQRPISTAGALSLLFSMVWIVQSANLSPRLLRICILA